MTRYILTLALALGCLSGCIFADNNPEPQMPCDEGRRCASDNVEVCDADGEVYACAAYAACLNVTASAERCAPECPVYSPPRCEPDEVLTTGVDARGCTYPYCEPVSCPEIACNLACPDGFVKDARGCDTCACVPHSCPPVANPVCEPGESVTRGEDEQGCPYLYCEQVLCADPACALDCPGGYASDARGCPTCECLPVTCDPPICTLACEFGFATDPASGCQVCDCAEPTQCTRHEDCSPSAPRCVPLPHTRACCGPDDVSCDDNLLPCEGICEPARACERASDCQADEVCRQLRSRSCCSLEDPSCEQDAPMCPAYCESRR